MTYSNFLKLLDNASQFETDTEFRQAIGQNDNTPKNTAVVNDIVSALTFLSPADSLKVIRAHSGMSQSKFANYMQIKIKSIWNWEQGVREPPRYILLLIAYAVINSMDN